MNSLPSLIKEDMENCPKPEFTEIDTELDDALDEGYMGMECTLERGFSLNDSSFQHDLWMEDYKDKVVTYTPQKFPHKYKSSFKHFLPYRQNLKESNKLKLDDAGMLSFLSFGWLSGLMWKAYKNGLSIEDLPLCSSHEMCLPNTQRLSLYWEEEVREKGMEKASLKRPIWRFVKTRIAFSFFVLVGSLVFGFAGPTIFMRLLIEWLGSEEPVSVGVKWVVGLIGCELMRIILFGATWAINYRTAIRLRAACLGLVHQKLMRVSHLGDRSIGEVINLFANDSQRIFDLITMGSFFVGGPLVAVGAVVYIQLLLGPWALLGMTSFLFFYLFQYGFSRLSGYLRQETVKVTDERVRMMSEIFHSVKLIKMYAWETCFIQAVTGVRNSERKLLERSAYVQSASVALVPTVPVFAAVMTFLAHILAGFDLTPAQNVLAMKEMENYVERCKNGEFAIEMEDVTLAWYVKERPTTERLQDKKSISKSGEEQELAKDSEIENEEYIVKEVLWDMNISIEKGKLVGVCGAVGSGKSSLLSGVLGQMCLRRGSVRVDGACAYVGQEAWVLNATLRDNILLGEAFDANRYYKVMYACCLTEDVALLPAGDMTEIGERGINLSGGQKQRVAIARAIYAKRTVYLLDDCLSAVDAHVAQHIFHWVVKTALKQKTIVFVTHQLQFLPECDGVLYIDDGRVTASGSHASLFSHHQRYSALFHSHQQTFTKQKSQSRESNASSDDISRSPIGVNQGTPQSPSETDKSAEATSGRLTSPEEQEKGSIPRAVYLKYISLCGGGLVAAVVVCTFVWSAVCVGFSSWWLAHWLSAGSGIQRDTNSSALFDDANSTESTHTNGSISANPDLKFYETVYGLSIVFILTASLIRGFAFMKTTIKASSRLHNFVFEKVLRAPMAFFECTPSGRVINLFSRDMDEVDVRLPSTLEMFLQNVCLIVVSLFMVCLVFPFFVVYLLFLVAIFVLLWHIFKHGIRDLKRFENTSRSPLFTEIATTVNGLASIQAYGKQRIFTNRFLKLFDDNSCSFFLFNSAVRWLAVRLDLLALTVTSATAVFCVVMRSSVGAASAGLALAYASQLSGMFQFTVRLSAETEARFTSVQRIVSYTENLASEAPLIVKGNRPNSNWPKFGRVSFRKVELKYRDDAPLALKGVSFEVDAMEKIGVVGRTGSGKSSLGAALFRLVELKRGSIFIDGINIASVGLEDLRKRLSIIPQDPILFTGTIRSNLDPLNKHSDAELWSALEQTHMKTRVCCHDDGILAPVVENGSNFSVGERQLLCMARAILRKSKILFLDEATASIDTETDTKIQDTLKEAFQSCTMITVAHRLHTILGCSRVLVLDNGSVCEFDSPDVLLKNTASKFSKLVAASNQGIV